MPPNLKLLKDALYVSVGAAAGFGLVALSPYSYCSVDGPSMRPTLNPASEDPSVPPKRDVILIRRVSGLSEGTRGSVVVLRSPVYAKHLLVKRLAALPGDGIVPLSHPNARVRREEPVDLPEGRCWVESDGGFGFADSNSFGPVDASSVVGVAAAVVWPPSRFLAPLAPPAACLESRERRLRPSTAAAATATSASSAGGPPAPPAAST